MKRKNSKIFSRLKEITVGVLGYSFMGRAHSNAYLNMPLFFYPPPAKPRLLSICGRNEQAVAEAAQRFGYEEYCLNWRDVIKDDRIELIDNVLPNHLHASPSIASVENGKHILCEKPLAMNLLEAKKMYQAAEKSDVKHMVGFNYRFLPAIRFAKKLLDEEYLGKILQYRAVYLNESIMNPSFPLVWRLQKKKAGTGALGDLGSHIIDLARFLVGEVQAVCGLTKNFVTERPLTDNPEKKGKVEVDDVFLSLLRFDNGAIGSIEASRFCAGHKNYQRVEIHGTEGSLVFNLERANELNVYSNNDPEDRRGFRNILVTEKAHPFMEHWWPRGHILGWEHSFIHEIHHIISCIVNDEPIQPYGATFYDGVKCQEIMENIGKSSMKNGWVTLN